MTNIDFDKAIKLFEEAANDPFYAVRRPAHNSTLLLKTRIAAKGQAPDLEGLPISQLQFFKAHLEAASFGFPIFLGFATYTPDFKGKAIRGTAYHPDNVHNIVIDACISGTIFDVP